MFFPPFGETAGTFSRPLLLFSNHLYDFSILFAQKSTKTPLTTAWTHLSHWKPTPVSASRILQPCLASMSYHSLVILSSGDLDAIRGSDLEISGESNRLGRWLHAFETVMDFEG